jgi:hypothetical protein
MAGASMCAFHCLAHVLTKGEHRLRIDGMPAALLFSEIACAVKID